MADTTQEQIISLIGRFPNSPKEIWQKTGSDPEGWELGNY